VIAIHAALAVPLVRASLRRREREHIGRTRALALLAVGAAIPLVTFVGAPLVAFGLAPRAVDASIPSRTPARPARIGIRETILMAIVVAVTIAASQN
jgi:hypothetical protein